MASELGILAHRSRKLTIVRDCITCTVPCSNGFFPEKHSHFSHYPLLAAPAPSSPVLSELSMTVDNPYQPLPHTADAEEQRPIKRRRRAQLACQECRDKKIRCDGAKPVCDSCLRKGNDPGRCVYPTNTALTQLFVSFKGQCLSSMDLVVDFSALYTGTPGHPRHVH